MRKLVHRSLCLVALTVAGAGCDPPAPAASAQSAAPAPPPPIPTAPAAPEGQKAPAAPGPATPPTTDELNALARNDNAFALTFYASTRALQKGNLAISPFSLHTALAMTWAGARGETAAEMKKVLHIEGDRALDVAGALVQSYGAPDQKITLRVANRLFGDKGFGFEAPYLSRVRSAFGAPLEPLDFRGAAPDARGRINAWVAKETEDRIKDLIPQGGVDEKTRLVLTNAVYFLGDWATPFKKEATVPAPFFTGKTEKKDVPTMNLVGSLRFGAGDGVKIVDLPYQNGALAMTLVLPDAVDGLDALEARLTPGALDGWLATATSAQVAVALPKLTIAPQSSLSVGDTLAAMGMPLAFDAARADFTGIANPPNPADRLYVSKVFHRAFVKVDEKGTEAAAASAVVMTIRGMAVQPAKEFKADHPFLFLLRDTRNGLILFMGRVTDPASR